jgi:hypothetical protein
MLVCARLGMYALEGREGCRQNVLFSYNLLSLCLQGEPLALLYFTLDCADFPVPKLHYTPVLAPASAFLNSITGYDMPFYALPDLQKYNKYVPFRNYMPSADAYFS